MLSYFKLRFKTSSKSGKPHTLKGLNSCTKFPTKNSNPVKFDWINELYFEQIIHE